MKPLLALRSLVFLILMPGTVAGYVPLLILQRAARTAEPAFSIETVLAGMLVCLGVGILLRCVWDFFFAGEGTLAPFDPPRHLVVCGLYRYTRNPMYNGVIAVLIGESWLFHSPALIQYALVVFVLFHCFVVLYEEPALASAFGDSYRAYRQQVPRWGFRLHAYDGAST
jgi:protein-S-isoprenylcysteine O-methyltransferase Ste14